MTVQPAENGELAVSGGPVHSRPSTVPSLRFYSMLHEPVNHEFVLLLARYVHRRYSDEIRGFVDLVHWDLLDLLQKLVRAVEANQRPNVRVLR